MEGARVTSWQMMMWHGASEEMLCAGVNPTGALEGGICPRIVLSVGGSAELAGQDAELAAEGVAELAAEPWGLLEASWDDARTWARVVLGREVDAGELPGPCGESDGGDRPISARMVVHLAASALTCVVGFRNLHFKPVTLAPSINARIAISTPKGVNLNGLQGSLRRRLPPPGGLAGGSADRDDDVAEEGEVPAEDMWPRALANMFGWREPEATVSRRPAGDREYALATTPLAKGGLERSWVVEERDEVHGPLSRIHRGLSEDVLLVDRGKRRSLSLTSSGMDTVTFRTSDATRERSQDEADYVHVTFEGMPVGVTVGFEEEWVGTAVLGNRNI